VVEIKVKDIFGTSLEGLLLLVRSIKKDQKINNHTFICNKS